MEPSDKASYPAVKQRDPRCFDDRPGELHMYVAPKEIQIGNTRDPNNRRLINLHNVPLGHNYIAPQINDGEEFAIGGDNAHIVKTLANHLKYRSDEKWHIVGIPESHLQNLAPKANPAHVDAAGQGGPPQVPATQAAPQQDAQVAFAQAELAAQWDMLNQLEAEVIRMGQEDGLTNQNLFDFSGQQNQPFQQVQQSGYVPQDFSNLGQGGGGGGLVQDFTQGQQMFGYPQQGNFGGLAQGDAQDPLLSQVQQSVFPQQGSIGGSGPAGAEQPVPMDYQAFMASQQPGTQFDALAPGAEVLYKPGEDDWIFGDQGLALGQPNNDNNSNNNNNTNNDNNTSVDPAAPQDEIRLTPLLEPVTVANSESDPITKVLRAHINSPGRFEDKSGTGRCDWCGRHGHEAVACIKWDPAHFDKAVCVVCNNAAHGIDECPRFIGMGRERRAFLLLDKGAWRPGVRSTYHPWTDYCGREYWGQGFPMTRRFVRGLADDERTGPMMRNLWKVWDYRRGVPREFYDARFDSVRKIVLAGLDEKFKTERPFSMYGDKGSSSRDADGDDGDDEDDDEGEGEAEGGDQIE